MKEIGLRFGTNGHLAGTLTAPDQPGDLGVVLLTAGLLHRVGPHRLYVKLARKAAERGVAALRFDMPGLGDSGTAPGRDPYEAQAMVAAGEAMDLLTARTGASRFVVAGLCSGADMGFLVASRDRRVVGLYMMEPAFFPSPLSSAFRAARQLKEYGLPFAAKRLWQRARNGELLGSASGNSEEDGRAMPSAEVFSGTLKELERRGVQLGLVYSSSSMGRYDLRQHRRRVFADLLPSPRFQVALLPHTDHLFTPIAAKEALTDGFLDLLDKVASTGAEPAITVTQEPAALLSSPARVEAASRSA